MRILVTGAGGFLGGAVARCAAAAGHEVLGTFRLVPGLRAGLAFDAAAVDLHDRAAVEYLLATFRPQAIVGAAWSHVADRSALSPDRALADISSIITLIDCGARHGLERFVGVGSQAEYGPIEGATDETRLPAPTTLYGAAKLSAFHLASQRCAERSISFAWARLFSIYGPGDAPKWLIPSAITEICAGRAPKTTSGRQLWDYLFIDDAAKALLALCLDARACNTFNLGSGHPHAVRSILEKIRDIAAPDLNLAFGEIAHRPDQIWHMEADITKLRAATGWKPRIELQQGLEVTIDAHRKRQATINFKGHY